jgi:anti-anti-sigma factor
MTSLQIAHDRAGGRHLLVLRGELDMGSAPTLTGLLESLASDGGDDVVVDLAGVTFVDSSGLKVLLEAHARAVADGRAVIVRRAGPQVRRVIDLSGIDGVLVFDDQVR